MGNGTSLFIIVVTLANIAGCLWLIWWTSRRNPHDASASNTTGHVWDGDLSEYNNPMPRWWLGLFLLTILFGFLYLALYPGWVPSPASTAGRRFPSTRKKCARPTPVPMLCMRRWPISR